jgi:hypothetical protein
MSPGPPMDDISSPKSNQSFSNESNIKFCCRADSNLQNFNPQVIHLQKDSSEKSIYI